MAIELGDLASHDALAFVERFEGVFREYYQMVLGTCYRRLGDHADAEDATQEVFSRAFKQGDRLYDDPRAWLLLVARNLCFDEIRRRRLANTRPEPVNEFDREMVTEGPERYVLGEMTVAELFSKLTAGERKVAFQHWLLDRSHREAGAHLGISDGTTRQLLLRARRRLVRYLKEEGYKTGVGALVPMLLNRLVPRRRLDGAASPVYQQLACAGLPAFMVAVALVGATDVMPVALSHHPETASWARSSPQALVPAAAITPVRLAEAQALQDLYATGASRAGGESSALVAGLSGANRHSQTPLAPGAPGPAGAVPNPAQHQSRAADFAATDIEPSPNYGRDHTVYASGTDTACPVAPCYVLFVSHDAGSHWAPLNTTTFSGTKLLLSPETYGKGQFFSAGPMGVFTTRDDGSTFQAFLPGLQGDAAVAPAGSGYVFTMSNTAIWGIRAEATAPTLIGSLPPGYQSAGPPAFAPGAEGGFGIIQPASPVTDPAHVAVVTCSNACVVHQTLDTMGPVRLWVESKGGAYLAQILSPTDIFLAPAVGVPFSKVSLPSATSPVTAIAAAYGSTRRVIVYTVATATGAGHGMLYSDDLGQTWTLARYPQGGSPRAMSQLPDGVLLAQDVPSVAGAVSRFVVSTDHGVNWVTR
ncbi:MAG: hypothetical protein NVS3B24_03980 [Candidatus Dormibacteria bacterium]